jgi:DNA-binding response OmpR family regulator
MAQRILVINDTQEILELFEEILTDEGYEVVLYSFATHDTAEIERHHPDLIILDYIFGTEKLGWQLLQKLKMRADTASIPIIICTAAIREVRDIEGFLLAKGVTLVPKPFDIDDLVLAVKNALASPETVATLVDKWKGLEGEGEQPLRANRAPHGQGSHNSSNGEKTPPGERRTRGKRQKAQDTHEPG